MTTPLRITTRNSTFQQLASLRTNRQKRSSTRTFLLEGVQPLNLALGHGWQLQALIHAGGRRLSEWANGILASHSSVTRYAMSAPLLAELSGKDEPSELIAVVAMRERSLAQLTLRPDLLLLAADRPANPGNLGTLIRSCDAFGADALVVTGHAVTSTIEPPSPRAVVHCSLFLLSSSRRTGNSSTGSRPHGRPWARVSWSVPTNPRAWMSTGTTSRRQR